MILNSHYWSLICLSSLLNHNRVFRPKAISQTFSLTGLDQTVAGAGRQNVSFLFDEGFVKQRIDRFQEIGRAWIDGPYYHAPWEGDCWLDVLQCSSYTAALTSSPSTFPCCSGW